MQENTCNHVPKFIYGGSATGVCKKCKKIVYFTKEYTSNFSFALLISVFLAFFFLPDKERVYHSLFSLSLSLLIIHLAALFFEKYCVYKSGAYDCTHSSCKHKVLQKEKGAIKTCSKCGEKVIKKRVNNYVITNVSILFTPVFLLIVNQFLEKPVSFESLYPCLIFMLVGYNILHTVIYFIEYR